MTANTDTKGSIVPVGVAPSLAIPFDTERLDSLMEEAELDAILATSKHSVQYLLGGYRYFFYAYMDAHGLSRYLPFFVYVKGRPDASAYVGSPMEADEKRNGRFWVPTTHFSNMTTEQYARSALEHLKSLGTKLSRVGVEMGFLPVDAYKTLEAGMPGCDIVDATLQLELLRAVKTPAELDIVRQASKHVVDSMLAVFDRVEPGATKNELVAALRQEEIDCGLVFEYCLINVGTEFNRAPSDRVWQKGEVLALDSGGNYRGYIGDLCRMAYAGEPDAELEDLLAEVEDVQQAARKPIRPGTLGGEIFAAADGLLSQSDHLAYLHFMAHGMGIISHEAPWLTDGGPVPYPAYHAQRPLEAGMVISIETTMSHPRRGFIKLEDTVIVTADGWEACGDYGRGWNSRRRAG